MKNQSPIKSAAGIKVMRVYIVVEPARLHLALQRVKHGQRSAGWAGGNAVWLLLCANEKMKDKKQ
jgi:hypothetical protein